MDDPKMDQWRNKLLQRAEDLEHLGLTKETTTWGNRLAVRITPKYLSFVHRAARDRNISVGGYVRRAVAKQVAKDLGISWLEVIAYSPYPSYYQSQKFPPEKSAHRLGARTIADDGEGYGDWDD